MPFPVFESHIRDLVREHVEIEDEPLLVAIYFDSPHIAPHDECLFEVLRNFGFNEVDEDHRIFQIQFGSSASFPLPEDDRLRLFLTNPIEFDTANREKWSEIEDLKAAIVNNRARALYTRPGDTDAERILNTLGLGRALA